MSYKQKVVKTLRCRNQQTIGVLAKLTAAISTHGGDIGDVRTISLGTFYTVRDITVICDDEAHLGRILRAVQAIPEVTVEAVIDEVYELHRGGKLIISPTHPVKSVEDLRKVYTPGVALISKMIYEDPTLADDFTVIPKTVALITNGTRVLGLGDIGPVAAMPVMEGKAALFAQFTGLHMVPILCSAKDPKPFVDAVCQIAATFAAIQLEDIRTPDCYEIEERLIERLSIPVMHDDQHGTAVVSLAACINACRLAGIDLKTASVGLIGLGAAGSAIARLLMYYTGRPVLGCDVQPHAIERLKKLGGEAVGSVSEVMRRCQVVIATTGRSALIPKGAIQKGQVILALSNPFPEITIEDAIRAGAGFASDGSRVNNLLGYPGILKGAVQARASRITRQMYIAAAEEIVRQTPEKEIVPEPIDPNLHERVARAVYEAAIESGVARLAAPEEGREVVT